MSFEYHAEPFVLPLQLVKKFSINSNSRVVLS